MGIHPLQMVIGVDAVEPVETMQGCGWQRQQLRLGGQRQGDGQRAAQCGRGRPFGAVTAKGEQANVISSSSSTETPISRA